MKLTVEQKVLAEAVARVAKLARDDSTIAIWGCVLLEARPDGLRLRTFNGEQATSRTVRATVSDPGALAIRASDFAALTKGLPKAGFELSDQDGFLHLRGARTKYRLAALSPDDFPSHPEHGGRTTSETFQAGELGGLLASVAHAICRDSGRPHLAGMLLETPTGRGRNRAGKLVAAATDGHRLAINAISTDGDVSANVIVPRTAIAAFRELLDATPSETDVTLTVSDKLVSVEVSTEGGPVSVATRMTDARFPPYEKVIPSTDPKLELQVNGAELVASIARMAIVRKGAEGRGIRMSFVPPDVLRIDADNPDVGDGSDELSVSVVSGTPAEFGPMGIESRYMTEAINALGAADVTLRLWEPLSAMTIAAGGELLQVVMPMRL